MKVEQGNEVKMKLLITGSTGFVAGHVIEQASENWSVHGVSRSIHTSSSGSAQNHVADLLEPDQVSRLIQEIRPDAVIHTAAMANIDQCQTDQVSAHAVNVGATRTIADLCKNMGIKLVYCSTDSIFDGEKGNYEEKDTPHPVNFYAETKVEAEKIVLSASDRNVVARLSLVMGFPVSGKGNSFLNDMILKIGRNEPVTFPQNEIRTPIDVITLATALAELAGNIFHGIIHLAGNTRSDRYSMAQKIADILGLPPESRSLIRGTDSNSIPGRARRPNDASLNNSKARQLLRTPMLTLEEGLQQVIKAHKTN